MKLLQDSWMACWDVYLPDELCFSTVILNILQLQRECPFKLLVLFQIFKVPVLLVIDHEVREVDLVLLLIELDLVALASSLALFSDDSFVLDGHSSVELEVQRVLQRSLLGKVSNHKLLEETLIRRDVELPLARWLVGALLQEVLSVEYQLEE
jgi:hypothetical protein